MSQSVLYGIKKKRKSLKLHEFMNGHGFGTVIWSVYFQKYLGVHQNLIVDDEKYNELWDLSSNISIPKHHRTILMATYDRSIISKPFFDQFIDDLTLWNDEFSPSLFKAKKVNHVPELLKFMKDNRNMLKKFDHIGIQVTNIIDNQYDVGWGKIYNNKVHPEQLWNIYDYV